MPLPRTFFDFAVGDQPLGRVVFELYNDVVPKTAENFRALCTGEKGMSPTTHVPLHFKSSPVHRIIDGFMIQGGDFTKRNGTGGESIYGGTFADERLEGEGSDVNAAGMLVMANRGPDTNGSQWFITLAPAPHLTGKHVVFGRVIHGIEHIEAIGKLETDSKDRPLNRVTISHCGELELRKPKVARAPTPLSESDAAAASDSDDKEERRRRRKARRREKKERKERETTEERRARKEGRGKKDKKDKKVADREETEAELDARLEREEKERLEEERKAKLAEQVKERERRQADGEVVYKGRGAMRFMDPESGRDRRMPTNYDSRQSYAGRPYGNGHRPRQPPQQRDAGERWQRGAQARPEFQKESLDAELDRYGTKTQKEAKAGGGGGGRDFDDWRSRRDSEWADDRKFRKEERNGGRSRSPEHRSPGRREEQEATRASPARDEDRRSVTSDMELDLGEE